MPIKTCRILFYYVICVYIHSRYLTELVYWESLKFKKNVNNYFLNVSLCFMYGFLKYDSPLAPKHLT